MLLINSTTLVAARDRIARLASTPLPSNRETAWAWIRRERAEIGEELRQCGEASEADQRYAEELLSWLMDAANFRRQECMIWELEVHDFEIPHPTQND